MQQVDPACGLHWPSMSDINNYVALEPRFLQEIIQYTAMVESHFDSEDDRRYASDPHIEAKFNMLMNEKYAALGDVNELMKNIRDANVALASTPIIGLKIKEEIGLDAVTLNAAGHLLVIEHQVRQRYEQLLGAAN